MHRVVSEIETHGFNQVVKHESCFRGYVVHKEAMIGKRFERGSRASCPACSSIFDAAFGHGRPVKNIGCGRACLSRRNILSTKWDTVDFARFGRRTPYDSRYGQTVSLGRCIPAVNCVPCISRSVCVRGHRINGEGYTRPARFERVISEDTPETRRRKSVIGWRCGNSRLKRHDGIGHARIQGCDLVRATGQQHGYE